MLVSSICHKFSEPLVGYVISFLLVSVEDNIEFTVSIV